MKITREIVAKKIEAYLHHQISLAELVTWAETSLMEAEFEKNAEKCLAEIMGRLGLADVREFGLSWSDCETLLKQLGYTAQVNIVAA